MSKDLLVHIRLLQFAQWALLDYARSFDDARQLPGQRMPIPSNAASLLRTEASAAADLIDRLKGGK